VSLKPTVTAFFSSPVARSARYGLLSAISLLA
jgi:hypothetical protein